MIAHLRGIVHRLHPTEVTVDVGGVGYRVTVPVDTWETMEEASTVLLWIYSYIREDRFDLYGFPTLARKTLFEKLIEFPGVGPKMGIELSAVPKRILQEAIDANDPASLSEIKGVGKKTAEKLLLELKSLVEKYPTILGEVSKDSTSKRHEFDKDAVAALANLGYDSQTIMRALKELPKEVASTEERVAAALRNL